MWRSVVCGRPAASGGGERRRQKIPVAKLPARALVACLRLLRRLQATPTTASECWVGFALHLTSQFDSKRGAARNVYVSNTGRDDCAVTPLGSRHSLQRLHALSAAPVAPPSAEPRAWHHSTPAIPATTPSQPSILGATECLCCRTRSFASPAHPAAWASASPTAWLRRAPRS